MQDITTYKATDDFDLDINAGDANKFGFLAFALSPSVYLKLFSAPEQSCTEIC